MDTDRHVDRIDEFFITEKRGEIYAKVIDYVEKMLIEKALEQSFGNQVLAAKVLGLNRNTLRTRIKKLDINAERYKRL